MLIKADKNPNTLGATLLGLAGPDAPDAGQIVEEALTGNLDALWVFGHDMVEFFGEGKVRELSEKVELFVFSGTNENPTASFAHWVLPTSGYVEKDGDLRELRRPGSAHRLGLSSAWRTPVRIGAFFWNWPACWVCRSSGWIRSRSFWVLPRPRRPSRD